MLRAVFRFAGLGIVDTLLGVVFSVLKMLLIVSVLYSWLGSMNKNYKWVSKQTIEQSHWYEPVAGITDKLTPYFEEIAEKIME